ncbi:polymorphic toxin type 28 domain-containing protein [Streptomyces sp. NPDC005151]
MAGATDGEAPAGRWPDGGSGLGAVGFILLAGDAAKQLDNIADAIKLAYKIASSPFSAKLDRVSEHLQMKDLTAAARELKGEVVARKADGTPVGSCPRGSGRPELPAQHDR